MKSVQLSFRRKFDDQYTFDLQNNVKKEKETRAQTLYAIFFVYLQRDTD